MNIGRIWKAARLLAGRTQVQLSRDLGFPQGTISKIENNSLEPSAVDWYRFCEFVGIDAHRTLNQGLIDGRQRFRDRLYRDHIFKFPLRYRRDHSLKVRELIPFRASALSILGEDSWSEFLSTINIDDELFCVMDFQVSLSFLEDLLAWSKDKNQEIIESALASTAEFRRNHRLGSEMIRGRTPADFIRSFVEGQDHYQRAAKLSYHSKRKSIEVNFTASDWIADFFDAGSVEDFLAYKARSLDAFLRTQFDGETDPIFKRSENKFSLEIGIA